MLSGIVTRNEYARQMEMRGEPDFSELAKIIDLCGAHEIDLAAVIMPLHARTLLAIEISGHWERYLEDQRAVVEFLENRLGSRSLRIVGLEHNPDITNVPITQPESWFEDGIHPKMDAINAVAGCFFAAGETVCEGKRAPEYLNANSFSAYREAVTANLESYKRDYQWEYALMKSSLIED